MGASARIAAAGAAVALFVTTSVLGLFVPLQENAGTNYLFAWPGERLVTMTFVVSALAVLLLYLTVVIAATRVSPASHAEARTGRWLAPLGWSAALALSVFAAAPRVGMIASPAVYFLYDLRWWWAAFIVWRLVANVDRLLGARAAAFLTRPRQWTPKARVFALDILVCLAAMGWAVATTPVLRFSGILHGDEPKYLRLCETLYQGKGLEIGHKPMMDERPLDAPSRVTNNITLFIEAATADVKSLGSDLGAFVSHPASFQWNRAVAQPNWFLTGKNGALYEVHQPGLSLLLFPGYYLDRHFLSIAPGYQHEFPADLYMTTGTLLLLYGLCGVALFRLLRHVIGHDGGAAVLGLVGVLTLPTTAFPFQIYPEIPAALIVLTVTTVLLCHREHARPTAAAFAGAAVSYLLWLHPRFLLLVLVLSALAVLNLRRRATSFLHRGGDCRTLVVRSRLPHHRKLVADGVVRLGPGVARVSSFGGAREPRRERRRSHVGIAAACGVAARGAGGIRARVAAPTDGRDRARRAGARLGDHHGRARPERQWRDAGPSHACGHPARDVAVRPARRARAASPRARDRPRRPRDAVA